MLYGDLKNLFMYTIVNKQAGESGVAAHGQEIQAEDRVVCVLAEV